ncbi:MAG: GxxExxY protein [Acidobacteriota bacterium]
MTYQINQLTHEIIGSAIEVHRKLGPGLLQSADKRCLCRELFLRGIKFKDENPLPPEYKGMKLKQDIELMS